MHFVHLITDNYTFLTCLLPKLHWEWRSCARVLLSSSTRLIFFKAAFIVRASEQGMDVAALLEVFPVFAGDMTGWAPDALITNYPTYSLVLNERNAVGPQLGSVRLRFVSLSLLNTEVLHLVDGWLSISPALCQTADF